jgi:transposase
MRGPDEQQGWVFSYVSAEERVPADHPIRVIRKLANEILEELSEDFEEMYARVGRPSIAPEWLLRAMLLQALYTIRSERQLVEQLNYNLLFRWFVGLRMDEVVWDASSFSKNRQRLLEHEVSAKFFERVRERADREALLSAEHFSVDGTLIEAWAGRKSFQPRPEPPQKGSGRGGRMQKNDTHASRTDPDARLYKKSFASEPKLCHMGHVMTENRHGLIVAARITAAGARAEREVVAEMIEQIRRRRRITLGADKAYDDPKFVAEMRQRGVTAHVAQYTGQRSSAIDRRTTRHVGYEKSRDRRKRIEQIFGWIKTVGGLRKTRHRGRAMVNSVFTFTCAVYNLVRIAKLRPITA